MTGGAVGGASNLVTAGAIPIVQSSGILTQDASNLFWDISNHRLGIGTNAPGQSLVTTGSMSLPSGQKYWMNSSTDSMGIGTGNGAGGIGFFKSGIIADFDTSKLLFSNAYALDTSGASITIQSGGVARAKFSSTGNGIGTSNTSPTGTLHVKNATPTTGTTIVTIARGDGDTADSTILSIDALMKFGGTNTTGAGSAALGANSPAVTNTSPYTWLKAISADGSTVYIPAWK